MVEEKIDFVHANLLKLGHIRYLNYLIDSADTIFINPSVNDVCEVDILRDCSPNLH